MKSNIPEGVRCANRVSAVSLFINAALSAIKFIAGSLAHSSALISDAVHSLSDVLSTAAVIVGINISAREADDSHQYGHERIESIFSVLLAVMLFAAGAGIGRAGILNLVGREYISAAVPGTAALAAAALSIIIKEAMYHYTIHAANKLNSTAIKADAWHHRSDALSSVGSFIGIYLARLGYPICDPIASILICLFIIKAAWDIFYSAANELVDRSASIETGERIREAVNNVTGVIGIDSLKTRLFGSKLYVDVEIACDGDWSLYESHSVAEEVHRTIEEKFPNVKHCMVHVNPR